MDITELLAFSAKQGASDLHLSAGLPPMIRVDGDVRRINLPPLEHNEVHRLIYDIMNDKQRKDFEEFLESDFSFEVPGIARFRVNAFNQNRGGWRSFSDHSFQSINDGGSLAWPGIQRYCHGAARVSVGDRSHRVGKEYNAGGNG